MKKGDGTYTYFVPDVAYHITKWQRGFGKVINIQGSDHHGTIARVRAGLQAANVGIPQGYPDYVLHKMVTVMKNGEEVKISKRAGSYVTLRDLIEWSNGSNDDNAAEAGDTDDAGDLTRGRDRTTSSLTAPLLPPAAARSAWLREAVFLSTPISSPKDSILPLRLRCMRRV